MDLIFPIQEMQRHHIHTNHQEMDDLYGVIF